MSLGRLLPGCEPLMELHQLAYFLAVAEEGSFTRAAERVGIAQPSLSQQIKNLEKEVGQPLFDRLPRGVALTEAGQRLMDHARRILAEVEDARKHVGEVGRRITGHLAVGAIPTLAPFLLPQAVRRFRASWPEVRFSLTEEVTPRLLDAVAHGELDLAITCTQEQVPSIHVEKIAEEPLLLVVPAGHRLAGQLSVRWEELADEDFVVLHDVHCLAGQVYSFCRPQGLQPRVAARGGQLHTLAALVSAGLGVSLMPASFRDLDLASDRAYLEFAENPPHRDICVAWNLLRYRTNAARALVRVLREIWQVRETTPQGL